MYIDGPQNAYSYHSYSTFGVKAYINSINLEVGGIKKINFKDGTQITFNNTQDTFGNTLIGTCHHMMLGNIIFEDKKNGLIGYLNIGQVKGKPTDYFKGYIEDSSKDVMCDSIYGTYMGYFDADGERLFDIRDLKVQEIIPLPSESRRPLYLQSDSRSRLDIIELEKDHVDLAQEQKHLAEVRQRQDKKLREAAAKRRKKGGPKIVFDYKNQV